MREIAPRTFRFAEVSSCAAATAPALSKGEHQGHSPRSRVAPGEWAGRISAPPSHVRARNRAGIAKAQVLHTLQRARGRTAPLVGVLGMEGTSGAAERAPFREGVREAALSGEPCMRLVRAEPHKSCRDRWCALRSRASTFSVGLRVERAT
jgi:hypothetical protein